MIFNSFFDTIINSGHGSSLFDGEKEFFAQKAKTGHVPKSFEQKASLNYDANEELELAAWQTFLTTTPDKNKQKSA